MSQRSLVAPVLAASFLLMSAATAVSAADAPAAPAAPAKEEPLEVKNSDVLAKYDSEWASALALGVQFLPDYDDTGKSSGLDKQQFFAHVTVDGRFGKYREKFSFRDPLGGLFHTGVTLSMLGSPVKREGGGGLPDEFNDVAKSIIGAGFLYVPTYTSKSLVHNFGPIVRAGAISRESLGTSENGTSSGDSVNWFYSVGWQYTYESFMLARKGDVSTGKAPLNGIPAGYFRLAAARFEDYAGLGRKTRLMADAAFQVYAKQNVYFGVQGNFGKGPDEFMVVVSMVRKPDEIAKLFSLGKDEAPAAAPAATPATTPATPPPPSQN